MTETPHLLDLEPQLVQASHGKRLANYLIDLIAFMIVVLPLSVLFFLFFPSAIDAVDSPGFNILDRIISLLVYGGFMGLVEMLSKGRSLGKYITGTKVVNLDGTNISGGTAFKRGFIRAIPFEAFSALGTPSFPWHDKWSNTYVIDIKASTTPE